MKETRCDRESSNSKIEKARWIKALKCVVTVEKSFMSKRTSTGVAVLTETIMEVHNGGVVVKQKLIIQVANTRSMSARKTMKMMRMTKIRRRIRACSSNTLDANAASKWAIR